MADKEANPHPQLHHSKTEMMDCTARMGDSVAKAHEIATAVQELQRQNKEAERKLHQEAKAHVQSKERHKALEEEHARIKTSIEKEKQDHHNSKNRMSEIERFHSKSEAALKAMRDDLMAVRLQNAALQAEMEVQRKAFVVNVNWAAMHTELKAKHDDLLRDMEQLHLQYVTTQGALETAVNAQEEGKAARHEVMLALERAKEDLARGEELLRSFMLNEEVRSQLGEAGSLKDRLEANKASRKKQREKSRAAMEKSLMANDKMVVGTVFNSWENHAKKEKLSKSKKEQSRAMAMRGIANSDLAVQDFCLTAWYKELQETKKEKLQEANRLLLERQGGDKESAEKARRKALAQLEKQFGDQDKALIRETYTGWHGLRHERMKKEKAKSIAARSIAQNGTALTQQVFQGWATLLAENKKKRETKAQSHSRAMRMITDAANAVMDFVFTQWFGISSKAAATKRAKEDGNTKALRMIAGHGQMLVTQCFTNWMQYKKKLADRDKKIKAVERGLVQGGQALVQYILQNWKTLVEKKKKSNAKKAVSMKAGLKKIAGLEAALQLEILNVWSKETKTNRAQRIAEELEKKKNMPGEIDPQQILNQDEAAALRGKLATMQKEYEDMVVKLQELEVSSEQADKSKEDVERRVEKAHVDLVESRKKAKDINEELTKVGQLLTNKPRKPSSRPTSGAKGDGTHLPRIDQRAPNTAREHRPESGGSYAGKTTSNGAAPNATKEAWS